jgi:D-alanyl-D-alanine carboxypeptidase/D-alanyl-D-alanine-endopeptidase (penicillin-binding protein 4)
VFGAPIMSRALWAVDVRSLDTGEQLYELNPGKLVIPASNLKIVTLATAADILGWDYRFTTALETTAPVERGVLRGDLIVRGNGDPTINSRGDRARQVLDDWAAALKAAGIHEIDGRIIGDDQAFDDEGLGAGWSWDYLQYGYAAPVGALQFNENTAQLTVQPGARPGDPAIAALTPGTGLSLVNRGVTGADGSAETLDYRRRMDRPTLEVTGSVAAGSSPLPRPVAVVNPTIYFAQSLKDGLVARGISASGDAADLDEVAGEFVSTNAARRVIVSTASPPLSELATVLMKASQNLYAETLVKAVGAARGGLGTWEGGLLAMRQTLTAWDVAPDAYVLADGSGLSRYNYVSARMITTILERMHHDARHRDAFAATLPIAGRDGTIRRRMQGTRAEGNAVAKTGSIANVRTLSGFVRTRTGEMLVFAILANDFAIPAATVNWIEDLAVEILSNFSRE